jgi:hypothetical protein
MIFAVMAVGFNSDVLIVDGTMDLQDYIQNLQFIERLDQKHGKNRN